MTEKKQKPGFFSYENLKQLAILLVIIFAIRWSIAEPYHVPTASMEPTIKVGDRLFVSKLSFNFRIPFTDISLLEWGTPKPGDIIVFRYPEDPDVNYVKRVVAVSGNKVHIQSNILYLEGEPQVRVDSNHNRKVLDDIEDPIHDKSLFVEDLNGQPHWVMQKNGFTDYRIKRNWPASGDPAKVPDNSVFVMGDNRDNSHDSRAWGHVPLEYVKGKALFVLWSLKSNPGSWLPSIRFDRFGQWLDGDVDTSKLAQAKSS